MIPSIRRHLIRNWSNYHSINHNPMMTGRNSGRYLSRGAHKDSNKRPTMRNNPIYRIRSIILCIILLSILPYKPITNNRIRVHMTTHRHSTIQSYTSTPIKYSNPTSIRSDCNMSPSRSPRKQCHTSYPRIILHCTTRTILHCTTSIWIYWSTIYNCRLSIRINIFCSNRISRSTCNYWDNIPNNLSSTTHNSTLFIKSPLWVWSSSMILTFCRRSLIIPIYLDLLMRKIK
jgi:hypothetical protein